MLTVIIVLASSAGAGLLLLALDPRVRADLRARLRRPRVRQVQQGGGHCVQVQVASGRGSIVAGRDLVVVSSISSDGGHPRPGREGTVSTRDALDVDI